MTMRVKWVPYGRPAAEALRDAIRSAKGGDPLIPVTVVVPSNHVGVAARRLLGSGALGAVCGTGTGVAAVSFLTVYRMAELLGSARLAGAGRRPVSTPVIAAALRRALAGRPGVFAPVAGHPATETALVSAYRELRDVSPAALDMLARTGARASDVVRLHRTALAQLEPEWYDEQDLIAAATGVITDSEATVARLGPVVVYLPQRLSPHGAGILQVVGRHTQVVVLAGATGEPRADTEVLRSVRRLEDSGNHVTPPSGADPMAMITAERTSIITTSDADEEVRAAVRGIVGAVRGGTPLERIAILYAGPDPYARIVHEQLSAAGIPHNGRAVIPLTARVAARALLGLLDLPATHFRREDVFAWLAGAPLLWHGHPVPVTAWERLSRDAGVVAGRDQWDGMLATFSTEAEAAADAPGSDAPEWRGDRLRTDASRARELRAFVLALIDDLAGAAARTRSWTDRALWAGRLLHSLLGDERRRTTWPSAEHKAAERVERAIDRLACLDRVEGAVSLDVFRRTLELELDADLGRVGRIGDGVMVESIGMGVGLDLDLVIVLGLAEGSFPAATQDDSLLPDHERITTGDELPPRALQVQRQHHQLLASLAGSTHHVLVVPRGDLRRSNQRVPSRWALQIAGALAGERWSSEDLLVAERPWIGHVASFDAGLRRVPFPASPQEYRLLALMAAGPSCGTDRALRSLGDTVLSAGAEMVLGRRSSRFTRFDGYLGGLAVPSPVDAPIAATRLEQWAQCPFAYLMRTIFRVDEVENPEDRLRISALDWGKLVHSALEMFIREVLSRPADQQPAPAEPWSAADERRMAEIGALLFGRCEERGLAGRPIFWKRDKHRILSDLLRFLHADSSHRREHGTRPVAAEMAFGFGASEIGSVALPLPGARSVRFHGYADRVDMAEDGTIHVVDYKTGKAEKFMGLSEDQPDAQGQKLQLAVYGAAARVHQGTPDARVRAEYWFTSARGNFVRVGYPVTDAVLEHVGDTVGTMVAGIEAGVFPSFATAASTSLWVECPYCDPDALGVADVRRQFERKQTDPAMTPFLDLVSALPAGEREEAPGV